MAAMSSLKSTSRGPFRADQLKSGDPYELSNGHPIYCAPTGGRGAGPNGLGFDVLSSDPLVKEAGVDVGYSPEPGMLRAPDVAIGNVPSEPGWVKGVPMLAVEYADVGRDEADLQVKIQELLAHGTQWVWVVRLKGPRVVEVHSASEPVRLVRPGQELTAPGILKNAVPLEALYDRDAAHEATLRNLLQRKGYESLEAALEATRAGELRRSVELLCEAYAIDLSPERRAHVATLDVAALDALVEVLRTRRAWPAT